MFLLTVLALPVSAEIQDTVSVMQNIVDFGNQNKGAKVSIIINRLRTQKIPIKHFSYTYTSPFIDSEGKSYLKSLIISYHSPSLEKWPVLTIYINENNCESEHFEDDMHAYDGNGEERADRIKDLFTIKKVEFEFWPVDYSKKK